MKQQAYLKIQKERVVIYLSYFLGKDDENELFDHLVDNHWELESITRNEFELWHNQKQKDPSVNSYIITEPSLQATLKTL